MVQLIGPGGAGKSTAGPLVANLLARSFVDLDRAFEAAAGSIDTFIARRGYAGYARKNVDVYLAIAAAARPSGAVVSLSSGFMTYPPSVHERYSEVHKQVASDSRTFVLLPSLDLDDCVSEIVRRQCARGLPGGRTAACEEAIIRSRFTIYRDLPARKVVTMRSPREVAQEIVRIVSAEPQ